MSRETEVLAASGEPSAGSPAPVQEESTDGPQPPAGAGAAATAEPGERRARAVAQADDRVAQPPDSTGRGWLSRRVVAIVLVLGYLANVAWRLYLVRHLDVPAAHADEDGYLVAARALAGGAGGFSTDNAAFRRVGYPLLISPVYWFTSDPWQVYRGTQVMNALINALTLPLAYVFGVRVLRTPRSWALAGAFVVAAMPAVVFYGEFAITDAVIATLGLCWLLLLHAWLTAGTPGRRLAAAAASGLVVGFIYVVHVRGLMLVLVQAMVVAVVLLLRRASRWSGLLALAGTAAAALLDPLLKYALADKIIILGRSPRKQAEDSVTTLHGMARAISNGFGQLWYLGVGTWGLGAVGLLAVTWLLLHGPTRRAQLRDNATAARLIVLGTALVATVFIAVGSSGALPPTEHRINYYAYPRYIHFLFPVWMLAGITALALLPRRRALLLSVASGGFVLLGAAEVFYKAHRSLGYRFDRFDAVETSFLGWTYDRFQVAEPTLVGLVLFALLALLLMRRRLAIPVMMALVLLHAAVMQVSTAQISETMVVGQYLPDTPRLVRDVKLGPGDVVAESYRVMWYFPYNHMREVTWDRIRLFNDELSAPPAEANVVIAPWRYQRSAGYADWDGTKYGFHRIAGDPHHYWAVWRRD